MKKSLFFPVFLLFSLFSYAQNRFRAVVKDSTSGEALAGVSVVARKTGETHQTDDSGRVQFGNLPD